jgi:hypothetical protein
MKRIDEDKIKAILRLIDESRGDLLPEWLDDYTNIKDIPEPGKELFFYESKVFTIDGVDEAINQAKKVVELQMSANPDIKTLAGGYTIFSAESDENSKVKYVLGIYTDSYLGESISFDGVKKFYTRVKRRPTPLTRKEIGTSMTSRTITSAAPSIDIDYDYDSWELYGEGEDGKEIIMLADRLRRFKTPNLK